MSDGFGPIQWFDWNAVERHRGSNLPHYEMPGAVYFVTFRLWDSLPAEVYEKLACARESFLARYPFPHTDEQDREFKRIYALPLERYLDEGLGSCVLRNAEARAVFLKTLLHSDGSQYLVGDYVVMPNHVHLLARVREGLKLGPICRQWKNLSSARINRLLQRRGRLWQSEPFDHIIRNPAKLEQCRRYIVNNPRHLNPGDFAVGEGRLFQQ